MALALGRLRITPREFWLLTMPELGALLRGAFGAQHSPQPMPRTAFDALRRRFPD